MIRRESKNEKERLRVCHKNDSLRKLRKLIMDCNYLVHDHHNEEETVEIKRWTEHETLLKTINTIQKLEQIVEKLNLVLPLKPQQ